MNPSHPSPATSAPSDTTPTPPLDVVVESRHDPASDWRIAEVALDWSDCSRERSLVYLFGGILVTGLFPDNPVGALGGVAVIFGAVKLFLRARAARMLRKRRGPAGQSGSATVRFTDSHLELSSSNGSARVPWSSLATSYADGGDFLVLFRGKRMATAILPDALSAVGRDRLFAVFAANGIILRRRSRWYRAMPWLAILLLAVAAFFAQREMSSHAEGTETSEPAAPASHADSADGAKEPAP